MEPLTSVVDQLKGVVKSTQGFARDLLNWHQNADRHNPIQILKRLQREAFSDIMKLRDRQEKMERMLTFYKSSKGSPFSEGSTHVRGKVDVQGAFFILDKIDDHKCDLIQRSGIRTGIDARITFETSIREKDIFVAEFTTCEKEQQGGFGRPLSLAKVFYEAHFCNWLSAVAIPMGAQCRDLGVATTSRQEKELTEHPYFGPSLLNERSGSAISIMLKKSNVVASLAHFASGLGFQAHSSGTMGSSGTFGQVVWRLSESTKLSFLGVHRRYRSSSQKVGFGVFTLPGSLFKWNKLSGTSVNEDSPTAREKHILDGSVALMLDTELDDNTRVGGWIEAKNSDPRCFQWALTMCDAPEDEFGWGLTLKGSVQGPKHWDHFQVETFLNLNLNKRFNLQPSLMFVMDGATQFPALLLRSSCLL